MESVLLAKRESRFRLYCGYCLTKDLVADEMSAIDRVRWSAYPGHWLLITLRGWQG